MHNELRILESFNIKNNNNINLLDQTNKFLMIENFKNMTKMENKSIISKIFYILLENKTICQSCFLEKYNYQVSFYLDFPLKSVFNYCKDNNITAMKKNRICIPLLSCFQFYIQVTFFNNDNTIYCSRCQRQCDSMLFNNIFSLPPILMIVLNRGKGNAFDCDVDFPQNLNLQNFVQYPHTNCNYKLKGVITHFGQSGLGGHFIAYCRHRIIDDWYCFNDSTVKPCKDQENDFRKGIPYILFYEAENSKGNFIFDEGVDKINEINFNQNLQSFILLKENKSNNNINNFMNNENSYNKQNLDENNNINNFPNNIIIFIGLRIFKREI